MTQETRPEVNKDVEVVHVEPAEGDESEEADGADGGGEGEGAEADSSQPEAGDEKKESPEDGGEKKPEKKITITQKQPEKPVVAVENKVVADDDLKEVPGETPRERALRLELKRVRAKDRSKKAAELLGGEKPQEVQQTKPELSEEKKKLLARFKPEDMNNFKTLLEVAADELGFVKKGELAGTTYAEKAQDSLDTFLNEHPEYSPQNDPEGVLWDQFKSEYGMYKPPANPKDFSKIFNKIHKDIFNIQPTGDKGKINAAREKIKVASHAGTSSSPGVQRSRPQSRTGLRLDALKGFSDEDLADMQSRSA